MKPEELRRLLELAAKAVGGKLSEGDTKHRTGPTWETWEWIGGPGIVMPSGFVEKPHLNDGHSRRLQLACKIDLILGETYAIGRTPEGEEWTVEIGINDLGGSEAARMAVLRAAAAIGEAMP